MVFWEILQSLGQTFDSAGVAGWMAGVKVGAGALTGTMGDALYGASWAGSVPNVGRLVSCAGGTPSRRLLQVVGAGSSGGRDWQVWRVTDWSDERRPVDPQERAGLEARAQFLQQQIDRWEEEAARNPAGRHRDISAQREELQGLLELLAPVGSLFVAAYVGYGRRWGRDRFVLRV